MFFQICFLGKSFSASLHLAYVGFLSCMNSQMVKEVVPFPEEQLAVFILALQNMYLSLCQGIFKLIYFEFCGWGHLILNFNFRAIKLVTLNYFYLCSHGYLFSNTFICNLISLYNFLYFFHYFFLTFFFSFFDRILAFC